jgi:hypothetical protein
MTTPKRPLHAVPEPGGPSTTTFPWAGSTNHHEDNTHTDGTSDQERDPMSGINTSPSRNVIEKENVMKTWARRVFVEPWNELVCAVIGLAVDVILGLVALAYMRNGVIPTWLDEHGHLAWMGAGAVAALFLLSELRVSLLRLYNAVWESLDRRYMKAVAARLAAADLAVLDGGEHR